MADRKKDGTTGDGSLRRTSLRPPLAYLWVLPASLIGVVAAVGFRRRSVRDGVLLCEGAVWPRRLGWGYRAITFGHVVLCLDDMDDRTWAHEFVHVRQFERWGVLFLAAYPAASLWARFRGGHHYLDNRFEVAARRQKDVS